MRHRVLPALASLFAALFAAAFAQAASDPDGDDFLRAYAETRGFALGQPVKAQPTPDGRAVLFLRAQPRQPVLGLYEFDVATGRTRELLAGGQVPALGQERISPEEKARRERMRVSGQGIIDFQLSPDGAMVLAQAGGDLFVVDRLSSRYERLDTGAATVLDPKFSPNGLLVAYVVNHDLRVYDPLRGREHAVTQGGSPELTHGLAEFVAQEEMGRFSGYWWSPDSRFLVYEEADATGVEPWQVADPSRPDVLSTGQFYPRPGKRNVQVRLGVVSARGGKTRWLDWDRERYPYLARVEWHEAGGLTLSVQTRDQRELTLLSADPRTGKCRTIWIERDPAWVNLDQQMPRWIGDGKTFLWTSEREGAWQLEVRDREGCLERVLVPAGEGYQGLLSVDESAGLVYYRASMDPRQSHLYRVPLAGGDMISLTAGRPSLHTAVFARNHQAYVHTVISLEEPPRSYVRLADHTPAGELPSVAEAPPFVPEIQMRLVGAGGGIWTKLVRPRTYEAGRKYPVLVHVYGGPHTQMVQPELRDQLLDQWLADQGFVVVAADGRGTPGRGRDWERALRQSFNEVALADQITALRALGAEYPELDLERVGIYGWSFGGYMAALAVLERPDVFKAAVAGAPVTDWLDYDTHYTERYLGVPDAPDDVVYRRESLIERAPGLAAHLLLIHGTADDNVFMRHSLKLGDALLRAGRDFEWLPLAGATHLVTDPVLTERLWQRRAAFFRRHLGVKH